MEGSARAHFAVAGNPTIKFEFVHPASEYPRCAASSTVRRLTRRRLHPDTITQMTEDTCTATLGSTKRCCDQDTSQSCPKRVKVEDTQQSMDANLPNSSSDTPQSSKKSQKRRDAAGYPKSRQGKAKDGKNVGRRRRNGPETREADAAVASSEADPRDMPEKPPRLPKRQSAILLGFCGTGCAGMQMSVCSPSFQSSSPKREACLFFLTILCSQPDVRTIEGVLFDALVRVGAVSSDNAGDSTKVSLARAARTDAGVHAAGNLVSLKLITQIPGVPDVVAAINDLLPPEIRVWGINRVQNSFNARTYAPFIQIASSRLTENPQILR